MPHIPEIPKLFRSGVYVYDYNWIDMIDTSNEYKIQIKKCIEFCQPDMYFNYLYRFIIRYDFNEHGIAFPDKNQVNKSYLEAALKILKERCSVILSEEETEYSFEWKTPHRNYSKEMESYKTTVFNYINYHPDIYPIIGINKNENPYLSNGSAFFFQNVMFVSFLIAYNRIQSEIDNNEFFGLEIVPYSDRDILNIYLTPNGMYNLDFIYSWDKNQLILYFNTFIKKLGFNRITEQDQLSKFGTSILFEKDGKSFYHSKFPSYDYSNTFITKKLDRPHLSSIILESQASYKCVDTYKYLI